MELFEAIHKRRAVRFYRPDPVSRESILKILDAANWAPSALNRQQWEFLIITGKKILELGESYRSTLDEYLSHWDSSPMRGFITRDEFIRFAGTYGGAPVVIVVLTPVDELPNFHLANIESASAAVENLLLAATALGLGTCWMTGPLRDESGLRRILAIPDEKEIVAVTPLGYPEKIPATPPRIDPAMEQKVRWVE